MVSDTQCSTFLHQPATGRAAPVVVAVDGGPAERRDFCKGGSVAKNDLAALLTICRVRPSSSAQADQFSDIHLRY